VLDTEMSRTTLVF